MRQKLKQYQSSDHGAAIEQLQKQVETLNALLHKRNTVVDDLKMEVRELQLALADEKVYSKQTQTQLAESKADCENKGDENDRLK